MQTGRVTEARARELRHHPAARDIGFGWLRISKQEYFPDRVILVSSISPVAVTFRHRGAGLEPMRASLAASIYACRNPSQGFEEHTDAVECDALTFPTAP
jgi:hypothetical protein